MEVGKDQVKQCGVVVVMEVGVKTRARAMAVVTEEMADNSVVVKRRKLGNEKLRSPSPSVLKGNRNGCCDAAASPRSGGVSASCCSSTGSIEKLKVSDLEESVDQNETIARYNFNGNESTPGELESTTTAKNSPEMNNSRRKVLPAEKMPPEAELEEFFASAQKGLNERFKNKYNYDIVNDIPLEGRFEWIQVKQEE